MKFSNKKKLVLLKELLGLAYQLAIAGFVTVLLYYALKNTTLFGGDGAIKFFLDILKF